jgi:hypothetical protein
MAAASFREEISWPIFNYCCGNSPKDLTEIMNNSELP